MENSNKYTIKEIAEMAGVSRATVDRVLHGRGIVSPSTAERIKSILEKIDYSPNLLAQSLKKGKLFRIAVLVPDPNYDVYWQRAIQGINEGKSDYAFMGIDVDIFLYNPYKPASFNLNSKIVLEGSYDGIVMAPFLYRESLEFFAQCDKLKIPYVTFNTFVKESNPLCFVGQDLVESGRTSASILNKISKPGSQLMIIHLDEDIANAKHMQEKEEGFLSYFTKNGINDRELLVVKIDSLKKIDLELGKILTGDTKVGGIFVTTSKVHYIGDYLKEYGLDIKLIGFDFIEANIDHLKQGVIDVLIYQNPWLQAKQALSQLVDHIAFKKNINPKKILPASIVIKENLNSYLIEFLDEESS